MHHQFTYNKTCKIFCKKMQNFHRLTVFCFDPNSVILRFILPTASASPLLSNRSKQVNRSAIITVELISVRIYWVGKTAEISLKMSSSVLQQARSDGGTYTFASQPRALTQRKKYRELPNVTEWVCHIVSFNILTAAWLTNCVAIWPSLLT
jgi:hypothetical protein